MSGRGAPGLPGEPGGPPGRDGLRLATEVALFGVTAAAVLGMHRLFADGSFRAPVLLQAGIAHLSMAVLRRRHVPLRVVTPLSVVLALLSITWARYLDTTWLLLPSPDTWSAMDRDLVEAWHVFQGVEAPAPVVPGFVVLLGLAVWVIAFIGDWGAFRTGVSFEALLPPGVMFLFGAVLGARGGRVAGAALFAGTALAFLLLHRVWRQEETAAWVASRYRQSRRALVTSGVGLACLAVLSGAALGPQLPGAGSGGIASLDGLGDEEQTRVVISPLVDIQSRLVDQSNLQVFTVETDEPGDPVGSYWRLTALDDFDGSIWRSAYETDDAAGSLPTSVPPDVTTRTLTQTVTVRALAQIWLPAAYEPVSIDTGDTEVDYDPASSTLIVDRDEQSSDGMQYTVTSEIPTWTAEQLRQARPEDVPDSIADRHLELPDDFSDDISALAQRLTQDASSPYDKALALQNHLRSFEYTLQVQPGHGDEALEQFLFENRRGYCEQFAGAFAAMARSIDIPSRVVVGFTKGTQDRYQRNLYRVNGEHAHAWVELYFHGYGWVTFDPTPTRAPPGAPGWLGIPEQQQDASDSTGTVATTVPGGARGPDGPTPGNPRTPDPGTSSDVQVASPQPERDERDGRLLPVPKSVESVGVPLAVVVLGYVSLVPLAFVLQRAVRRRRAREPAQQVGLAWQDMTDEMRAAGLRLSAALTVTERAVRMRTAMPEVAADIDLLARVMEQATYAERPPSPAAVEQVMAASARVSAAVARRQPWWRRIGRYLDIRRLLPRREGARRSAHGVARSRSGSGSGGAAAQPA